MPSLRSPSFHFGLLLRGPRGSNATRSCRSASAGLPLHGLLHGLPLQITAHHLQELLIVHSVVMVEIDVLNKSFDISLGNAKAALFSPASKDLPDLVLGDEA